MKLQLSHQQCRFRLSYAEFDCLLKEKKLEETVCFPTHTLSYQLCLSEDASTVGILIEDNKIILTLLMQTVRLHQQQLPSREGIRGEVTLPNQDKNLIYFVEVDVKSQRLPA